MDREDDVCRLLYAQDFLDYLTKVAGHKQTTRRFYAASLRCFCELTKVGDPRNVTAADIDRFGHRMARAGFSPNTRHDRLTVVRIFFRWLASRKIIEQDPTLDLRLAPRDRPRISTLTDKEIDKIIFWFPAPIPNEKIKNLEARKFDHAQALFRYHRDTAVLATIYCLGLRADEPAHMTVSDLNISSGSLRTRGKGKHKYETRFIHDQYIDALRRFLAYRESIGDHRPELFPANAPDIRAMRSGGYSQDRIRVMLKRRFRESNLYENGRRIAPHILRYSLATRLARAKLDIDVIRQVLRHASITTTQHYIESVTLRSADALKRRVLAKGAFVERISELESAADALSASRISGG